MERPILTIAFVIALCLGFLSFFSFYFPSRFAPVVTPVPEETVQAVLNHPPLYPLPLREGKSDIDWQVMPGPELKTASVPAVVPTVAPQAPKSYLLKTYQPLALAMMPLTGPFSVPKELEKEVEFWRNVFGKYKSTETVLHHPDDLTKVYGVLDFSALESDPTLTQSEKRILRKEVEESWKEKLATKHKVETIRSQIGQKDRFEEGLIRALPYLPHMEAAFRKEGVPTEITRLAFVESMFTLEAKSKVGAAGPWQFIRSTGRRYLQINHYIDERLDPIYAAHGAARLLKKNYALLGTWPLAINAYNSGEKRLLKAVRQLRTTEIATIIKKFQDRGYQFASRNFYPEFLAALEVANHPVQYFGTLPPIPPLDYVELQIDPPIVLQELAETSGIDIATLQNLNPALHETLFQPGHPFVPGLKLRIPAGMVKTLLAAIDRMKSSGKREAMVETP